MLRWLAASATRNWGTGARRFSAKVDARSSNRPSVAYSSRSRPSASTVMRYVSPWTTARGSATGSVRREGSVGGVSTVRQASVRTSAQVQALQVHHHGLLSCEGDHDDRLAAGVPAFSRAFKRMYGQSPAAWR